MVENRSHPIRNSVIASLITASMIGMTSLVPGGWSWAFGILKRLFAWFVSPVSLPIWFVCILALGTSMGVIVTIGGWLAWREKEDPIRTYTEDRFFDMRWSWSSCHGRINRLASFCPHCDFQVLPRPSTGYAAVDHVFYHCDECNRDLHDFPFSAQEVESRFIRKIQQEIRRKLREVNAEQR